MRSTVAALQTAMFKLGLTAFGFVLAIFAFESSIFAQGSDLEKKVYGTTPAPKKSTPKPPAKPASKKPAPAKKSGTASTSNNQPRKSSSNRRSSGNGSTQNNSQTVNFKFNTPDPNQEVWLGEQKLGVSDDEGVLEKSIRVGNYLVSVRDTSGAVVLNPRLVSVSAKNPSVVLVPDDKAGADTKDPAEESLSANLDANSDVGAKVLDILKDYADPLKTSALTRSDWEFVYETANANSVRDFSAVQIEGQRWFASGQIDLSKGKYEEALTAFQKSRDFMINSAYPDYAIGETYLARKQSQDALRHYVSAATLQPGFALAHARIAEIYASSGKEKESAAAYKLAIDNGFESSTVRYEYSKQLMKLKRWDEAAVQLEAVLKVAPTGDVYQTLGDLYRELKRPISAYESFRRATELSPDSSLAFYKLGEVLFEEREFDKSKVALERAMELDKKGVTINISLARKYIREASEKMK
ncbi:MAG: tetratricopeptide repeat protein [Pyrinomonadaceae bacterium]